MSITETNVVYVEPRTELLADEDALVWFTPRYLLAVHPHPLDRTIVQSLGGNRTFYVKWWDQASDHPDKDETVSVTQLLTNPSVPSTASDADIVERRTRGVQLHRYIECVLNGFPLRTDTLVQRQVAAYYHDCLAGTWVPFRTEMPIRSSTALRIVGVVDALFMPATAPTGSVFGVYLTDWKYSTDVRPCLDQYTLQLHLYKYILESTYGTLPFVVAGQSYTSLKVVAMEVVAFHESMASYRRVAIDLTDTIGLDHVLAQRQKQVT